MAAITDRLDTQEDVELARAAQRHIAIALDRSSVINIAIVEDGIGTPAHSPMLRLPSTVLHLLADMLDALAEGKSVTIMPKDLDITTQQAALFLNVSRPYLIRLLEDGKIAYHKVGTHRRIRFEDVVQYKEARQKRSSEALQQLVDQAQELGLGY
jgi:excisionase family DNA binding protein